MSALRDFAANALLIGAGATLLLDLWSVLLQRVLAVPAPNWSLVGRWIGHVARGRWRHPAIGKADPVRSERALGWAAHYAIGIAFATALLLIAGLDWARAPTLLPALIVGVATVVFPFFVLQPGMGLGFAASKAPNPLQARLRSLLTHTVFGIALYVAASVAALLIRA
jgi:hypothetical protein